MNIYVLTPHFPKEPNIWGRSMNQTYLKSILDYHPFTGTWTWKHRADRHERWNVRFAGKKAGSNAQIMINKKIYQLNALAFLYIKGFFPSRVYGKSHRFHDLSFNKKAKKYYERQVA